MTMLEQTFRRDRLVVSAAVGAIAVTAWFYLIWLTSSHGMSGMAMPDMMDMPDMMMDPDNALECWRFRLHVRDVDRDDGGHDVALDVTNGPHLRARSPTGS